MARCEKLLEKAESSPNDLRLEELCRLAECYGYEFARMKGSHRIYKRPGRPGVMNFQAAKGGKAKPFQVKQLLREIEELEEKEADDDAEV